MIYLDLSNGKNKGAAMMILVFFFVFISVVTLAGIINPVVRESRVASNLFASKKSYFLAESGTEDAIYRIRNNKQISATETLSLDGDSATVSITTTGNNQKQIDSIGDSNSRQRKISVDVTTSTGVSFNYGLLAGIGGVDLSGGGTINGNVYANGPIVGDSSAIITGTAISANSPSLSADQSNGSGTPSYNISFGNSSSTQDIAQSFQVSTSNSPVNKLSLYIKKVGSPSNATVKIVSDSNGSPSTTVIASGTLNASSVTTSYGWIDVSFSSNPFLSSGTTYWLVVDSATSSTKYYTVGASNGGYANGLGKIGQQGGTWSSTTPSGLDYYFSIYLGGVNGSISGNSSSSRIQIGTTSGIAQAHTVDYTNVTGNLYCQSGTGNNKSCTTGQGDPVYQQFPISNANISQWETDALVGGTYTGNYSVGSSGATIGPKKIVGDLSVHGGGILTVTGTLWVTGDLSISGGAIIKLSSGYSTNDGVIIVDGTISISGGGTATGSGTSGSYILLLTKSTSSNSASISGGAGAVIIYAPYGTISLTGGASLKEATGYRISLSGGSSVTYESGLVNNNFSSGPSGSWSIDSWKESQ